MKIKIRTNIQTLHILKNHFGNTELFAKAIYAELMTVENWLHHDSKIPYESAIYMVKKSNNLVKLDDIYENPSRLIQVVNRIVQPVVSVNRKYQ